jgi:site-specific recombinase XerD
LATKASTPARRKPSTSGLVVRLPPGDLRALWESFIRHHRTSLRPATIDTYGTAVGQFATFLAGEGASLDVKDVTREQVEDFIALLYQTRSPGTAANRYRALNTFFGWLVEEGELDASPTARMRPPVQPEAPPPVLDIEVQRAIVAAAAADKTFDGRRDEAVLRLFLDSGIRRGEMVGLRVDDIDLDRGAARVTGKGERTRLVGFGTATAKALDRYLRQRARHPAADTTDALWLGHKGALQYGGIRSIVARRAAQAGVKERVYPHLFRHTWNDAMLSAGAQESDVMALAGWRSPDMVRRYAAATRATRALDVARRLSPGDKL